LERLHRLRLANNQLTNIEPDTFAGATDLELLDLSNNTISQPTDGSFVNQPSLTEFRCSNCSWTSLPEQIFMNMSGLKVLRLDHNEFKRVSGAPNAKAIDSQSQLDIKLAAPHKCQTCLYSCLPLSAACAAYTNTDAFSSSHLTANQYESFNTAKEYN